MPDPRKPPLTAQDWDEITGAARQGQDDWLVHQEMTRAGDRLLRALAPLAWAALGALVVLVVLSVVEVVG